MSVKRFPSRAFSYARGHLRVLRVSLDGQNEKRDCSLPKSTKLIMKTNKLWLFMVFTTLGTRGFFSLATRSFRPKAEETSGEAARKDAGHL